MLIHSIWIIVGFVLLMGGADYLIKGACELANRVGVSPLIIGLTIVAAGTSAPELFVSANAALKGAPDVAIGNVVGSNTFNILVIVGLAALFKPLNIAPAILRREMPLMLMAVALFVAASFDLKLSRWEGLIFCAAMLAYLLMNYILVIKRPVQNKAEGLDELLEEIELKGISTPLAVLFIVGGIIAMIFGSDFVVDSATVIAKSLGVSDLVIGITLIAIGTSLPEVAATLAAARRDQADIALGNAIGSNLFNVLCVLGVTAAITPINISEQVVHFDNWIMLGSCLLVFVIMKFKGQIGRISGICFLVLYASYMTWLTFQSLN